MTLPRNTIPIPILRLTVGYNPITGELWWLERGPHWFSSSKDPIKESKRWNKRYCGKPAFNTKTKFGYLSGNIRGVRLYKHRVLWALTFGHWPALFLDHINGDKTDNRISNLREADKHVNNRNASKRVDNTSGEPCVYPTRSGKYKVQVWKDGSQKHIGTYNEFSEAVKARNNVYRLVGFSERHGK
jgi:hypothetical protein